MAPDPQPEKRTPSPFDPVSDSGRPEDHVVGDPASPGDTTPPANPPVDDYDLARGEEKLSRIVGN